MKVGESVLLLFCFLFLPQSSVPIPFKGDYVEVDSNQKWQKLYKSTQDAYVVFADTVNKVNRADGKVRGSMGNV